LDKARVRWGEDRQALKDAQAALASVALQILTAAQRPIE
jgi:hypothetical protein